MPQEFERQGLRFIRYQGGTPTQRREALQGYTDLRRSAAAKEVVEEIETESAPTSTPAQVRRWMVETIQGATADEEVDADALAEQACEEFDLDEDDLATIPGWVQDLAAEVALKED